VYWQNTSINLSMAWARLQILSHIKVLFELTITHAEYSSMAQCRFLSTATLRTQQTRQQSQVC
jgi:hypothetical protein